MNVGTPVVYVDSEGNEWAGTICGRTWTHYTDPKDATKTPVRNEDGNFNVACIGHDGQTRYVEGVPPSSLTVADLSDVPPVFTTKTVNAAVAAAPAAPVAIDYDALAAAMFRAQQAQKATE